MTAIDYIRVPVEILKRRDLSDTAKMLLALIQSFNSNGLILSNSALAEVFGTSRKKIARALSELLRKGLVEIAGRKSRWRKIYWVKNGPVNELYWAENGPVEGRLLAQFCPSTGPILSHKTKYNTNIYFTLRDGGRWELPSEKLAEYEKTFRDIDIHRELLKAAQWLLDNPGRRKTARGMPRFLSGWLSRCKPTSAESQSDGIFDLEKIEKIYREAGLCTR